MARSSARSKRKYTGKKYKYFRKKRKRELERPRIDTEIGPEKMKKQRIMGGNFKQKLFGNKPQIFMLSIGFCTDYDRVQ